MPFNAAEARKLTSILGGFANTPFGDIIPGIIEQLNGASDEIRAAADRVSEANNQRNKAEADRDAALESNHKLRSGSADYNEMLEALKKIAKSPKGSQARASAALKVAAPDWSAS